MAKMTGYSKAFVTVERKTIYMDVVHAGLSKGAFAFPNTPDGKRKMKFFMIGGSVYVSDSSADMYPWLSGFTKDKVVTTAKRLLRG